MNDVVHASDRFDDDRAAGTVLGSTGPDGAVRLGVDREGLIAIDNGALRLQPLARSGWGREGIAYGPFEREPGLAMSVHVLNGHHSSQTFHHPESPKVRLRRILTNARRFRFGLEHHYENLAVGFSPERTPRDPLADAHSFVVHAATGDNGELWISERDRAARVALGILNVPFVFVVVLRADGAAYYVSSIPGATGATAHPMLQPVGIDTAPASGPLYATIQQRILGEVGYRVDTRVYGVRVATVDLWSSWYGTAHAADDLTGVGFPASGRVVATGQTWQGADSPELATGRPVGLLHTTFTAGDAGAVTFGWRVGPDGRRGLSLQLSPAGASVTAHEQGGDVRLLDDPGAHLRPGVRHAVEIVDGGGRLAVRLDGALVGDTWTTVADQPDPDSGTISIGRSGDVTIERIEAHPRQVLIPDALDTGSPWQPDPSTPLVEERFDMTADDLHGSSTPSGARTWSRDEGEGRIELLGDGARVRADREAPNPGRTVFTVPWDDPTYADIELDMTMPGAARGEGHEGRCGLVLWQDPENYIVANLFLDNAFDGASVSTFYRLEGYENMYDAVWTLVRGVEFGRRCHLRVAFDGMRLLAEVNGEPALVRALTDVYPTASPLKIDRVGIVVNREWGDDTGTRLHRFVASGRA